MVAHLKSIILKIQLLAVLASVASFGGALAYTEKENFAYIKSILNLLNNNERCLLPTYDEIDNLHSSFVELESILGPEALEAKLDPDEKLVRKTILDQWLSFQESMNPAVVIRLAKQRAFLCKIEAYQSAKFGSSVCTKIKDNRKSYTRDFEKNPVVRYVSHIETGDVPYEPNEPNQSNHESDEMDYIILTPVEPDVLDERANREEINEEFDPLVDIPVPPVSDVQEELTTTPIPSTTTTPEEPATTDKPEPTTVPPIPAATTEAPATTPEPEPITVAPIPTTTSEVPTTTTQPETTTLSSTITTNAADVFDLNKPAMVSWEKDDNDLEKMNQMPEDSLQNQNYRHFIWPDELPLPHNATHDTVAKYLWIKFCNDPDSVVHELEPEPEFETTHETLYTKPGVSIGRFYEEEPIPLIEEIQPEPEYEVITTVAPVVEEIPKKVFKTSKHKGKVEEEEEKEAGDEHEEENEEEEEEEEVEYKSVHYGHELEIDLEEKEKEEEVKARKIIRRPNKQLNPKLLKKQKEEFMKSANRNQRVMEHDVGYYGNVDEPTPPTRRVKKFNEAGGYWMWVDEPVDSLEKKDKWTTLMNNNMCKVRVNKDLHGYNIKKMRIIKKTKSFLGADSKSKKTMMDKKR